MDLVHRLRSLDVSRRPPNQFWAFNSPSPACELTRAFHVDGANLKSPISMADEAPRAYHIKVENPHGVCRGIAKLEIDGKVQESSEIVLADDAQSHDVRVILGAQDTA